MDYFRAWIVRLGQNDFGRNRWLFSASEPPPGLDKYQPLAFNSPAMKPASRHFSRISQRTNEAFTLLEILVVLAIIGMLVGLAVTNVGNIFSSSQTDITRLFVKQSMQAPLSVFKIHMGDYPTTAEGLQALIAAPANKADRWRGPYLNESKIPTDPWGEPYQYRYPGVKNKNSYDLWSKGPDKIDGTDDDIGNW
jgi:general secretion pathway protein G